MAAKTENAFEVLTREEAAPEVENPAAVVTQEDVDLGLAGKAELQQEMKVASGGPAAMVRERQRGSRRRGGVRGAAAARRSTAVRLAALLVGACRSMRLPLRAAQVRRRWGPSPSWLAGQPCPARTGMHKPWIGREPGSHLLLLTPPTPPPPPPPRPPSCRPPAPDPATHQA